ncbi:MAG TPA: hypothetical protein VGI40_21630 [Pirellulaceae bacterium]|jgi:hypothetical protein
MSDDSTEVEEEYPYRPQPPMIDVSDDAIVSFISQPLHNFNARRVVAAICLATFFAGVNLIICPALLMCDGPLEWRHLPVITLFGAILAEGGLLSACLVFFSGTFWLRGAICWTIGSILWAAWAAGLVLVSWYGSWGSVGDELQVASLSLPLVLLAIQLPLWFARTYLCWRLTIRQPETLPTLPFSIRDYFVGTAIVAISITFARLARPATWPLDDYWPAWAIVFCIFTAGSLAGVLPAMYFSLRLGNVWLGVGLLSLYAFAVASLIAYILNAIDSTIGALETAAIMTFVVSLPAFLGLGFVIARACGYVLETGRVRRFRF